VKIDIPICNQRKYYVSKQSSIRVVEVCGSFLDKRKCGMQGCGKETENEERTMHPHSTKSIKCRKAKVHYE
jgi:hypothetical protein